MFEPLALFSTGVFFGAALYVSLAQHPASLEAGVETAARFFVPMYRRAAVMQGGLAVVGTAAALCAWWTGSHDRWLVGGVLLFASVPVTLLGIMPTNRKLLAPERALDSPETEGLLRRWGKLHGVRSVLSGVAFAILVLPPW